MAKRCAVDLRHLLRLGPLGHDAEDAAADPITAIVSQRVLGVALDRVVPVADVHRAVWAVAEVDRDEAEVFGKQDVFAFLELPFFAINGFDLGINAIGVGSFFVYKGPLKGILISYLNLDDYQ